MILSESEVLRACQTLFGPEVDICKGFLFYLQPEGARSAYRRKAKETHPDLFACDSPQMQKEQTRLFRDIADAYDIVTRFIEQRQDGHWLSDSHKPRNASRPGTTPGRKERPAPCPGHDAAPRRNERLVLPKQRMQIGRFLYYRGYISYRMLIDALIWQRKQRPVIGDIARQWGWLNSEGLDLVLQAGRRGGLFGEKAVDLDLLSAFQVRVLLSFQHSRQQRLGKYFMEQKVLRPDQLDALLDELRHHNEKVKQPASRVSSGRRVYA